LWLDVLQLASAAGSRAALGRLNRTMPIHLVGGGRDPATGKGQAMRWLARRLVSMGFLNVGLTIHAEMRHETLNEIGRQDAMQAFAAWADDVVSRQTGTP
jgi:alpha-beta hydrolase superfamily lysophospholipase